MKPGSKFSTGIWLDAVTAIRRYHADRGYDLSHARDPPKPLINSEIKWAAQLDKWAYGNRKRITQ